MSAKMRAKMVINTITQYQGGEALEMSAVSRSSAYPEDGSDEDNTYSKFTPSATVKINIANPALAGQFKVGEKFYVDFTPVA